MKIKLIKRLHEIMVEIIKADNEELNKIGQELADIEKKLIAFDDKQEK